MDRGIEEENYEKLNKLYQERKILEKEAAEKYKDDSRLRLEKILQTKCRTIMIGSLSVFEEIFGELWEKNPSLKKLWEKARTTILDKGNGQIRAISKELEQHEVKWLRYQYRFEFRQNQDNKEDKDE